MKIKKHDKNPCSWSAQAEGKCKNLEKIKKYVDYYGPTPKRCSGSKCLTIEVPKPFGPRNSTALLSNFNIDEVLADFEKAAEKGFFKNIPAKHIPFEMCDFMKCDSSQLKKINELPGKYFFCVLNTDSWAGRGKHWVCVFINRTKDFLDVEYFNSSGNGLKRFTYYDKGVEKYSFCEWKKHLENKGLKVKIREVVNRVLQKSHTECGVWCLWYIKSRLEGESPEYFFTNKLTDEDMIEKARKMIFSG